MGKIKTPIGDGLFDFESDFMSVPALVGACNIIDSILNIDEIAEEENRYNEEFEKMDYISQRREVNRVTMRGLMGYKNPRKK